MTFFETIQIFILGIIQGITEFLPVSSSAHLIIFRDLFGIGSFISSDFAFSFDVALHMGTLLAIGLYFFNDFLKMFKKGFTKGIKDSDGKILWFIVFATIPAAIAGFLFEDTIDEFIRGNYFLIASSLLIMGIVIYLCDKLRPVDNSLSKMKLSQAITIGCSQIFALIPGFSRSGTTIAMSRYLGLNREDAAKFSFYLSAPITLGAVILHFLDGGMIELITSNLFAFISGVIVSFITGIFCIKYLLKYLKKHDFKIFMWYRVILAIIVFITLLIK